VIQTQKTLTSSVSFTMIMGTTQKSTCTHKRDRKIDFQIVPSRIYKKGDSMRTNMKQSS
jgi:hypothetical protein